MEYESEEHTMPFADQERCRFFSDVLSQLSYCKTISTFREKILSFVEQIDKYAIPPPVKLCKLVDTPTDNTAINFLSEDIKKKVLTLKVGEDGNCFYRSISLLLFGTEECHKEIRVRCAAVLCLEPDVFLQGENWVEPH